MFNFSPEAKRALIEAGWYEGRRIDTTQYRQYAAKHGFFYGEAADTFLRELGGLEIIAFRNTPARPSYMVLESIDAMEGIWLENVGITSRALGKSLTAIGWIDDSSMGLFMSEDQTVYADFMGYLCLLGFSAEEAIEAFVHNRKLYHIDIAESAFRLPNARKADVVFGGAKEAFARGFTIIQHPHVSASVPACLFPSVTFTIGAIPFVLPITH